MNINYFNNDLDFGKKAEQCIIGWGNLRYLIDVIFFMKKKESFNVDSYLNNMEMQSRAYDGLIKGQDSFIQVKCRRPNYSTLKYYKKDLIAEELKRGNPGCMRKLVDSEENGIFLYFWTEESEDYMYYKEEGICIYIDNVFRKFYEDNKDKPSWSINPAYSVESSKNFSNNWKTENRVVPIKEIPDDCYCYFKTSPINFMFSKKERKWVEKQDKTVDRWL